MRKSVFVFYNNILAGTLCKLPNGYEFKYEDSYLESEQLPQIAFSFPKQKEAFFSKELFAFFYGMLSEGSNRKIQEKLLKIDSSDNFSLLFQFGEKIGIEKQKISEFFKSISGKIPIINELLENSALSGAAIAKYKEYVAERARMLVF